MLVHQSSTGLYRKFKMACLAAGISALAACGSEEPIEGSSSASSVSSAPVSSAPPASSSAPVSSAPPTVAAPIRIQAQDYTNFLKTSPMLGESSGPCGDGEVNLVNTSDQDGVCALGYVYGGEWVEYTVPEVPGGDFNIIVRVSSATAGRRAQVSIDGTEVGVATTLGSGWESYHDSVIENVFMTSGSHTLRLTFPDGEINVNYVEIVHLGGNGGTSSSVPSSSAASSVISSSSAASSVVSTSSASSASSAPPGGSDGDPLAGLAEFNAMCNGCHEDNQDGTFGSNNFFDINNLRRTTLDGLADYLDTAMPIQAPGNCVGQCAEDIAAFLKTYVGVEGPGDGDPGDGDPGNLEGTPEARGAAIFGSQCATCHDGERVQGLFDYESMRDKELFTNVAMRNYIEASMPLGNPGSCGSQCAADVASYISTWYTLPMSDALTTNVPGVDNPVENFQCTQNESYGYQTIRLLTQSEFQNTVEDLFGYDSDITATLPTDLSGGHFPANNRLRMDDQRYVNQYRIAAETVADWVESRGFQGVRGLNCGNNFNNTCASNFVDNVGLQVFRRPLTSGERSTYMAIAGGMETGGDVREGMRLALTSMLFSPQFLYRHEIGEAQGNGTYQLTPYELATFLSYSLAGTTPSQALLEAAANGGLSSDNNIRQQAAALLDTPRAEQKLKTAVQQWLGTGRLSGLSRDQDRFPGVNSDLVSAMQEELRLIFARGMLDGNASFADLYAPGRTYVNSALATHYGIPAPTNPNGNGFGLSQSATHGGLLLNGAFLTLHGDSVEPSPIRRAVNIREELLCQDFPPPPPGVNIGRDEAATQLAAFLAHPETTNRMSFQRMTEAGNCRSCHAELINPLGFGLEDYDTVGRFRTTDERGNTVSAVGAVYSPFLELQFAEDPERVRDRIVFEGGQELATMMAQGELSSLARSCLSSQMINLSTGVDARVINKSSRAEVLDLGVSAQERDGYRCDVQRLSETLENSSPRAMLEQLGTLDTIRYRRAWSR